MYICLWKKVIESKIASIEGIKKIKIGEKMSKAKIKFNLDSIEDAQDFERCVRANDMASVIWDFVHNSRKTLQQEIAYSEGEISASEAIDKCFQRFYELLEDKSINIDKLYN